MKEFIIPFFGLKTGIHTYDFDIGQSFFKNFEGSLIDDGTFKVSLALEKSTTHLVLDFKATGKLDELCDRCGDPIVLNVRTEDHVIVKFGDETFEQTEEIIVLPFDAHEIDVSQIIYEMLVLGIPLKKVHPKKSDCNQEVISRLTQLDTEEDKTDPRWDALKKLK